MPNYLSLHTRLRIPSFRQRSLLLRTQPLTSRAFTPLARPVSATTLGGTVHAVFLEEPFSIAVEAHCFDASKGVFPMAKPVALAASFDAAIPLVPCKVA